MATWRDRMGPATFRDVPFFVETSDIGVGRKTIIHEYPQRDMPYVEDLGRLARRFSVEGYVIGADYMAARDRLLVALEQRGSGTLVHPYYGTRTVAVASEVTVRESTDQGGMATFRITFVETASTPFAPVSMVDAPGRLTAQTAIAFEDSRLEFVAAYETRLPATPTGVRRSLPGFVFESAEAIVTSAAGELRTLLAPVVKTTQVVAEVNRDIDALVVDAGDLVRAPFDVAARLQAVIGDVATLPELPDLGRLAKLAVTPTIPRPSGSTPARTQEAANYDALRRYVRRTAIITDCSMVPLTAFDSYDAAIAARDALLEQLDEQADQAGSSYDALVDLRGALARAIPGDARDLPRLITYTPVVTEPSLVITYRLYGALDLNEDVIARNHLGHPGFVLGGRPLQVLAHA